LSNRRTHVENDKQQNKVDAQTLVLFQQMCIERSICLKDYRIIIL